jgi:hypothetical protein
MPVVNASCVPLQETPHAPQSVTVRVLVSQPVLSSCPRQWAYPSAHFQVHVLSAQVGAPFVVLHTVPHFPQFKTSSVVETQYPPQHVPPPAQGVPLPVHIATHLPLGLHFLPGPATAQSPSVLHSTQRWLSVWQCCPLAQSPSALQPTVHWFLSLQ